MQAFMGPPTGVRVSGPQFHFHLTDIRFRCSRVTRSALQNAASVATLLLTSDALIADMPEDKKGAGGGGHGGYEDMY